MCTKRVIVGEKITFNNLISLTFHKTIKLGMIIGQALRIV